MFNFNNSKKNLKKNIINPLMDLSAITEAKDKTKLRDQNRDSQSEALYHEALMHIENFRKNNNDSELKIAAQKLEKALTYQRNNGEYYFWLAYIFYIFSEDKLTYQYLRLAESLSPNYDKIKELKEIISKQGVL